MLLLPDRRAACSNAPTPGLTTSVSIDGRPTACGCATPAAFSSHSRKTMWVRASDPDGPSELGGSRPQVPLQRLGEIFELAARRKIGSLMAQVKIPTLLPQKRARRVGHPDSHPREIRPISSGERIVLEGGSIDVNGAGTILTTEECLLSKVQERNPHMTRVHYEKAFADYLGAPHTIWLGRGIVGDDTHGHVDDLTRFVAQDTVVTMVEPNSKDVNHAPLRANLRRLQSARDQDGRQLTVVELPMPQPVVFEGRRLPASYANFYIANGVVLAPVFNRPNDRIALNTLAELFPTREIVPIYSGDFIWGLGAMHCMTQQQPA
jgi:agmatine deiminase